MKSRIRPINDIVQDEVRKAVTAARNEIYDDVSEDIVHQTIACCLLYMEQAYGFRKERLKKVAYGIADMMTNDPSGCAMSPPDILKYIKDRYEIDVESIGVNVS